MTADTSRAVRRQARKACLRAALLGALLFAARTGAAAEPLRLCADPANLPLSSDQPANPGLYIEIGRAIAAALGRPAETVWSLSYFGKRNLGATLLAGQCDIAVGLPDDPDFMGPRVIFSRSFLSLGYALLVPAGLPVLRLDDLAGHKVAVQFGTPPQSLLAQHGGIVGVTAMSPEEAVQDLQQGKAEAAFVWGPQAGYLNTRLLGGRYSVIPVDGPGMQWRAAIGFARTQKALRDAVDAILPAVAARVPELAAKYGLPGGTPIRLNQAAAITDVVLATDDGATPAPASAAAPADPVKAGQDLFNGTCAHCHGPDGVVAERRINLRQLHHRYGDQMDEVFHFTVTHGRPSKGMPNWSGIFTEDDFARVLAFLKTVQQD